MKKLGIFLGMTFMVSLHAEPIKKVDPNTIKALDRMGTYLRSLNEYHLTSHFTFDLVLKDHQKIQLPGTLSYLVKKPNNFIAQLNTGEKKRDFIYDGKTFTIFDPVKGFFAQVSAPKTIDEFLGHIESKYGIELPMRDLITWGQDASKNKLITSAMLVTEEKLNDEVLEHYAVRQGDIDWQIWIAKGDKPLPRKMVISFNNDPARPQFSSNISWSKLGKQNFAFNAPKGSYKIDLRPIKEEMMMQQEGTK